MREYMIRFAERKDIDSIMRFIDEYWRKDHILSRDRELFEWQYINNHKANMVLGVDDSNEIYGILGYIPYSAGDDKDFSLALWKARPNTAFLGVKLLMFLIENESHRNLFCVGINIDTTGKIYHRMGIKTEKMKQWYRLRNVEDYRIAVVMHEEIRPYHEETEKKLNRISSFQELKCLVGEDFFAKSEVPYKSEQYVAKRYFNHPIYEYLVYLVEGNKGKSRTAIVLRVQECKGSRVLRFVDCLGDYTQIMYITKELDGLLEKFDAEYIDMFETGLADSILQNAGWSQVGSNENIIPNYFAPYIKCNVDINICTSNEHIVLFRGDGDQDRPN